MKARHATLAAGLVLALALAGCTAAPAVEETPAPPQEVLEATLAIPGRSSAMIPILVAEAAGLFEEYGVDVTITEVEAPQIAAALQSGEVDATPALASGIRAAYEGLPLTVVAVTQNNFDYVLLANGITDAEDLEGKSIVTGSPRGNPGVALAQALDDLGLVAGTDVEVTNVQDAASRVTLLLSGQADASIVNLADAIKLMADNPDLHIVYEPTRFPAHPDNGLIVTESFLAGNEELVKRLVSALMAASSLVADEPDQAKELLAGIFELDDDQVEVLYELIAPTMVTDSAVSQEEFDGQAALDSFALEREVTAEQVEAVFNLDLAHSLVK